MIDERGAFRFRHERLAEHRGDPITIDLRWQQATRRLTRLGHPKRTRPYISAPANDRGHRRSQMAGEDSMALRLVAAAGVALVSMLILTTMGIAAIEPQLLLQLLG